MRYVLDFGSANAGGSPTFDVWSNLHTLAALDAPTVTELGEGTYQFDYAGGETVVFKASLGGVEVSDVIAPNSVPGIRNVLDFGSANAGGAPAFSVFARLDTGAALTQPAISEIGAGLFYFDYDFNDAPAGVSSVAFKAELAGLELSDVISATVVPGGIGGYKTAGALINRAAAQCGLDAVDDPYASSDPNFVLFRELLASLGEELVSEHGWGQLERDHSFTTVEGQTVYAFPDDFDRMVPQTGWNQSTEWALAGPVTAQRAQALKVLSESVTLSLPFRPLGARISFPVEPPASSVVVAKYLSRYWVQGAGSMEPDLDAPAQAADLVLFDPLLVVLGLKLRWLETKGFDTTATLVAYTNRLEKMKGKEGGPVLRLDGGGRSERFLDGFNVPETGYGS